MVGVLLRSCTPRDALRVLEKVFHLTNDTEHNFARNVSRTLVELDFGFGVGGVAVFAKRSLFFALYSFKFGLVKVRQ